MHQYRKVQFYSIVHYHCSSLQQHTHCSEREPGVILMEGKLTEVWPTSDIRQDTAGLAKDMRVIIERF